LYDNDDIIGFCAVLHQPHGQISNLKRCSRLVILPDYQGIGLGTKFLSVIAEYYYNNKYQFTIVTSAKNVIGALSKSPKWKMIRYGVNKCSSKTSAIDYRRTSMRSNCSSASFKFVK
jgi:GNAT superfamily N-acetyltransferase